VASDETTGRGSLARVEEVCLSESAALNPVPQTRDASAPPASRLHVGNALHPQNSPRVPFRSFIAASNIQCAFLEGATPLVSSPFCFSAKGPM
jgi:hypothetical protein